MQAVVGESQREPEAPIHVDKEKHPSSHPPHEPDSIVGPHPRNSEALEVNKLPKLLKINKEAINISSTVPWYLPA